MSNDLYVVLRCGLMDSVDPVLELEKVMKQKGRAWFGKYGQTLNRKFDALVNEAKKEVVVVLLTNSRNEKQVTYAARGYRLRQVSRTIPSNKSEFPKYYLTRLHRIRYWFLLEPYVGRPILLQNLVTKSSYQPLLESVASSMRGHFFCSFTENVAKRSA